MNVLYVLFSFLVSRNPAFKNERAVCVVFPFWCSGILPLRMNLLYIFSFLVFFLSRNPASKNDPALYVFFFFFWGGGGDCLGILTLRMNLLYMLLFLVSEIQPLRMNLLYMLWFLVSRNPASKNEPALYVFLGFLSRNPASKNEPSLYVVVFGVQESSLYEGIAVYVVAFWCPGIQPLRMNLLYMLLFLVSRNPAFKSEPAVYVLVFWCQLILPLRINLLYMLFSFFGVQESCH